jgi:hypothetical protein
LGASSSKKHARVCDGKTITSDPVKVSSGLPPTIARANALEARTLGGADADAARVRALAAYKTFLDLWKNAEPSIPIYKEAKAEHAKLLSP